MLLITPERVPAVGSGAGVLFLKCIAMFHKVLFLLNFVYQQ